MERETLTAIKNLSDAEIHVLIGDYEQFEAAGVIGDCKLREVASSMSHGGQNVTIFMTLIAMECYRHFANKFYTSR